MIRVASSKKVAGGFTIVEVMVVLAVSGAMLFTAAALIDGRQAKTEFTTGIDDEQQQLQEIIGEAASGYYPNGHDFKCTSPGNQPVSFLSGSQQQGTNAGCIFLGKLVQFGLASPMAIIRRSVSCRWVGNQY